MTEQQTAPEQQADPTPAPPAEKGDKGEAKPKEPDTPMIPKARFDEVNSKLREYQEAEKKRADERNKAEGKFDEAVKQRDQYQAQAEKWAKYATERLESISAKLSDEGREALSVLPEDTDLSVRLALAEKLAGQIKKPDPAVGSAGGSAAPEKGGLIPPEVTTPDAYRTWVANLGLSKDPKDRSLLVDRASREAMREEARRKGFS